MANLDEIDAARLQEIGFTDQSRRQRSKTSRASHSNSRTQRSSKARITKKNTRGVKKDICNTSRKYKKGCTSSISIEGSVVSCMNCDKAHNGCSFCPEEYFGRLKELQFEKSGGRSARTRNPYACDGCSSSSGHKKCQQSTENPSSCTLCFSRGRPCTWLRASINPIIKDNIRLPETPSNQETSISPPPPQSHEEVVTPIISGGASDRESCQSVPSTPIELDHDMPDPIWLNDTSLYPAETMPQDIPLQFDPMQEGQDMLVEVGQDMVFPLGMPPSFSDVSALNDAPFYEDSTGSEMGSETDVFAEFTTLEDEGGTASGIDAFTEFTNFDLDAEEVQLGGLERGYNIVNVSC